MSELPTRAAVSARMGATLHALFPRHHPRVEGELLAAEHLPRIRGLLEGDARAAVDGDPAATGIDEVLLCYPGFLAVAHYRVAREVLGAGDHLVARIVASLAHSATGIDIHPGAGIGPRFFIDHGTGVVIGETAVVGANVRLYQGVTLGANRFERGVARHPIIEDDVVVYANASILGRITVGRGSVIGGNVWLTKSVPPHSHITQARAVEQRFEEGAGI